MNGFFCKNIKTIILLLPLSLVTATSESPPPRSVSVALETSFFFEPKDINENLSIVKNFKEILDKLYKILAQQARHRSARNFRTEADTELETKKNLRFFDFLKNAADSFLNFTEVKLEDAFKVIKVEVSKITDQVPDEIVNIKNVEDTFKDLSRRNTDELKGKIKKVMTEHNPPLNEFARRMNDYYTEEDVKKLNKILRKITRYLEKGKNTSKVVKELLRFGILNKYQSLNQTFKTNLINDVRLLSEYMFENKKIKVQGNNKNSSDLQRKPPPTYQLLFGEKTKKSEEPLLENKEAITARKAIDKKIVDDLSKKHSKKNGINKMFFSEEQKTLLEDKEKMTVRKNNKIVFGNVELIVHSLKKSYI